MIWFIHDTNWFSYSPWEFLGLNLVMCFVLFRCAFSASVKQSSKDSRNKRPTGHWRPVAPELCPCIHIIHAYCIFTNYSACLYHFLPLSHENLYKPPVFSSLFLPSQVKQLPLPAVRSSWQDLTLPHCWTGNPPRFQKLLNCILPCQWWGKSRRYFLVGNILYL